MKRALFVILVAIGLVLLVAVTGIYVYHGRYYAQHNALLAEIQRHPNLSVVDHWRHEDMTLEDFGFAVRSARATAFVNVWDNSHVRWPTDRAVGIAVKISGERIRSGTRLIRFDGLDWRRRGLPAIETMAELLAHFDDIAHSLETEPPPVMDSEGWRDHIIMEFDVGRRRSKSPAKMESKSGF